MSIEYGIFIKRNLVSDEEESNCKHIRFLTNKR